MSITNNSMNKYEFLKEMYGDAYFPKHLVKKGHDILVALCLKIEKAKPPNLDALYRLTHAATDEFNDLAEEFAEADSEIETAARECICIDMHNIAKAYGFADADIEELTATRDW
jgi:hypothetical protein